MRIYEYIKFKIFILIFLGFNLILQPVCIYLDLANNISLQGIILNFFESILLNVLFSGIINELIFWLIFCKLLKGKLIADKHYKKTYVIICMAAFLLFLQWLLFYPFSDQIYTYPIGTIAIITVIGVNHLIISNGLLICRFKIIPLETINWYRVRKRKHSLVIYLRYGGNKTLALINTSKCIKELTDYFETHGINIKPD